MLELILQVNADEGGINHSGKTLQRVILEMNMDESRDFLEKI